MSSANPPKTGMPCALQTLRTSTTSSIELGRATAPGRPPTSPASAQCNEIGHQSRPAPTSASGAVSTTAQASRSQPISETLVPWSRQRQKHWSAPVGTGGRSHCIGHSPVRSVGALGPWLGPARLMRSSMSSRSAMHMASRSPPLRPPAAVTGGAIPVFGGLALDMRGLAGVTGVDRTSGLVTALCGTYGPELARELEQRHGLTLGHWPQSIDVSTVGGWVACRAVGQYSTRYGKIEDIVNGLEVVLADGRVVRTGGLAGAGPRSSTGPDLTQLFLGSEGTLGIITSAQLRARPLPPTERRAAFAFPSFDEGLEAIRRTLQRGATPAVVRLHDTTEAARSWGVDQGHLLIALDEGDEHVIEASMRVLAEECRHATPPVSYTH